MPKTHILPSENEEGRAHSPQLLEVPWGSGGLWWLIICANLTWLRDAQIAGKKKNKKQKTFFSEFICENVCVKDISIWIDTLGKEDSPHQLRWVIQLSWIEQKRWKKGELALSAWVGAYHPSSSLGHRHSWFFGLQIPTGIYNIGSLSSRVWTETIPSAFLGLHLAEGRLWDFSVSISVYLSISIFISNMYLFPKGSISLENPDR